MKFLLKLFIVFIIIGVIAGVAGFALIDFDIDNLKEIMIDDSDFVYVEKSFENIPDIIETDLTLNNINVTKSADENIYINYYTAEVYNEIECSQTENKISITDESKRENGFKYWFRAINFSEKVLIVNISVPSGFNKELNIKSKNGYFKIENLSIEVLKVDITNAYIKIKDVESTECQLKSTNGYIEVDNFSSTNLELKTTNGMIGVHKTAIVDTISAETTNGKIEVEQTSAKLINLKTTNGEVDGEELVADKIVAKNTNGRINISLNGRYSDYKIDLSTSNGKTYINGEKQHDDHIHNQSAEKSLSAKTTNGDVKIEFLD